MCFVFLLKMKPNVHQRPALLKPVKQVKPVKQAVLLPAKLKVCVFVASGYFTVSSLCMYWRLIAKVYTLSESFTLVALLARYVYYLHYFLNANECCNFYDSLNARELNKSPKELNFFKPWTRPTLQRRQCPPYWKRLLLGRGRTNQGPRPEHPQRKVLGLQKEISFIYHHERRGENVNDRWIQSTDRVLSTCIGGTIVFCKFCVASVNIVCVTALV